MPNIRESLLDAAHAALVRGDWARARMADIAAAAGVSRQTLYNEFGSRDALLQELVLREAGRFLDGARQAVRNSTGGPDQAVSDAMLWSLGQAHMDPLVKVALTDDAAGLLPFLTTRSTAIILLFRDNVTATLCDRWPDLDQAEVALVIEMATRLSISYLIVPTEPDESAAEHITQLVRRLLTSSASP